MKMETREAAVELIKARAEAAGFLFNEDGHYIDIRQSEDWRDNDVNFTARENISFDKDTKLITTTFKFNATIAKMGGEPTVEELINAARNIERAAHLMEELNALEISYARKIDF